MTKTEFLRELENALSGKIPSADINEVLLDYRDIFDSGIAEGRSEDDISEEIGSPASIARTILSDIARPKNSPMGDISNLASMSKRLGAYIIDTVSCGFIILLIFLTFTFPYFSVVKTTLENDINENPFAPSYTERITYDKDGQIEKVEILEEGKRIFKGSHDSYNNFIVKNGIDQTLISKRESVVKQGLSKMRIFAIVPLFFITFIFGISNLLTALQLWITNGYTLGKWAVKIRVVRVGGGKLTFWDCLLRDGIIKTVANAITSGILNLVSFIWACATPEHKTVQDLAANTKVINMVR